MKTRLLPSILLLFISIPGFSAIWTITNVGNSFSPSTITISEGDTVVFQLSNDHNVVEVSEATWNANGTTALVGGFQTGFGGGTVLPGQLGAGTHYYVCTPHAGVGMKGSIVVEVATSLTENRVQPIVSLYPNPATDQLWVESEITGSPYHIFDLAGKAMLSGTLTESVSKIDIVHLSAGVYFFQIGNQNVEKLKFIKK
jgi:plastocyanin